MIPTLKNTTGDENYNYLQDHLGSPIRLLGEEGVYGNSDGNETNNNAINPNIGVSIAYDVFGTKIQNDDGLRTSISSNPFGFTGYQVDDVAGLHYAQARYYMPNTGRFAGEDVIKGLIDFPITLNPYTYCHSNPLKYIDADGNFPVIHRPTFETTLETVSSRYVRGPVQVDAVTGAAPKANSLKRPYADLEVWLIHGSKGSSEHFPEDFVSFLMGELNIPRANIHIPDWGGNINARIRRNEGHAIASQINSQTRNPDTQILIATYSHGGNVGKRSINRLDRHYGFDLSNTTFVTIGTPIRSDYRLRRSARDGLNNHINVFNDWDSIQMLGTLHINPFVNPRRGGFIMDGWMPRYVQRGRFSPGSTNIRVGSHMPRGFDNLIGFPAHGAMHNNPYVWQDYILDLIVSSFNENGVCE